MIAHGKMVFYCSNCGDEINNLTYEKQVVKIENSNICRQSIIFNPSKCPHCGDFVEGLQINYNELYGGI